MDPFVYPSQAHVRRHGPMGYVKMSSFRPWLRDEFSFRCIYCLIREQWILVSGMFDIDHLQPVAYYAEKALSYDNLLYCCARCNSVKSSRSLPNPECTLIARDVHVRDDGAIEGRTRAAREIIRVLALDSPACNAFRAQWKRTINLAQRYDPELYRKLMGYPADLPDLSVLRPPDGNSRPEGVQASIYAQRLRGELPETY